jgi:ureidoglycolate hydrolase
MKIDILEFNEEGMKRVYENDKWLVGIKNWKPANDITGIDCLEKHNLTDELFVLIAGMCTLVTASEVDGLMVFDKVVMEPHKVYNIPKTMWHNTITSKDTKMILIEDSSSSMENSNLYMLSDQELIDVRELAK